MTAEEAIKLINHICEGCKDLKLDTCDECVYPLAIKALETYKTIEKLGGNVHIIPRDGHWICNGIDVNEAYEKQIPKRKHKYLGYRCICSEQVAKNQKYCEYCGQRLLDWSEEE